MNLGRVLEHEFLGHSVGDYGETLKSPYGEDELLSEELTAMKLVNTFVVEMGLEFYQRLNYRVEGQFMIFFGHPTITNSPIFIFKVEKQ